MIRNIVFDMGMVLLEYDPVKVCWEYTDNPEDVEWMRRELFDSKELKRTITVINWCLI